MTDQSNAPRPPRAKSLIEIAGDKFGLRSLQVPPLAPRPTAVVEAKMEVSPVATSCPLPESAEQAVVSAPVNPSSPAPAPAPVPVPSAAIPLSGEVHQTDRKLMQEQGLILPEGGASALLEEFRIVKRKLLLGVRESLAGRAAPNGQRILICSPHPGEGKTFCATNLALAIAAEKDIEVVLVDADIAKPSIPGLLGLPDGTGGLMDVLADPAALVEDSILATDIPRLFVLPAGSRTAHDSEHLASARTAEVLDRLTRGAPNRIVVFDSPPALAASPAAELAGHVGQIVLVARADRTGRSALEDAVSLLSTDAEIHLLLNAVQFSPSGRRFGAYYAEGDDQ